MFHLKIPNFRPGVKAVVSPSLDPDLLDLLTRHRDLTRQRLAISREIADVEREIQSVEQATRAVASPGVAVSVN